MMKQFEEAKAAAGDALLFFRMGDFYELFGDDACDAAKLVGLSLTSRDKGANAMPMAGFPHHQLEGYLAKLIAAGRRVAICDQVEDPKKAKGLVRREVTRIVTAGTVTDDALLDPRESNFLAGLCRDGDAVGLAWVELSTGRFTAATFAERDLVHQLARIGPSECLASEEDQQALPEHLAESISITERPGWAFAHAQAQKALTKHFGTATLEGFGFDAERDSRDALAVRAAGAVLEYLSETQKTSLDHIDRLVRYEVGHTLELDESTRRSLEITRTLRDGRREGSLLSVIDRTVTSMGSRLLADWLANPLVAADSINARLDAVGEFVTDVATGESLREQLGGVYDLERLLARVTTGRASPRDLSFIGRTLAKLPAIKAKLAGRQSQQLADLDDALDLGADIRSRLEAALADDCPLISRDGGFIREGFHEPLDELRELTRGGKQWIAQYQATESERTDIPNLKVGFNKVFGYYLEVTNPHKDKVPAEYIRKQTTKNAERYITPELKEYEEKVLSAEDKSKELEYDLFVELRDFVAAEAARLRTTARVLAELDVLAALADLARSRNYCRPEISEDPVLEIVDGRHPVLDVIEPDGTFVPNDAMMDGEQNLIHLITGPNMAGKSTYIRQVALLTLMAQVGSFVPARKATIGTADRIFARVGASDELSRGQSTFMVEMTETARILNTATPRSLVILDEIGRGTSTYDGLSLAWAIVEHLHNSVGCRTLFATHYHELTDLAQELTGVTNLNVAVREWEDQVVFLHKIVAGAADKSYGIHVARLAGVPREVNERAKDILAQLEDEHLDGAGRPKIAQRAKSAPTDLQLTLFAPQEHPLLDKIRSLDLNNTTPLDALRLVDEWRQELTENEQVKPR